MIQPQRARIRKRLEQEMARVNEEIAAIRKEPRAQELEGFGDNTPLSEEIDAISVTEEQELRAVRVDELIDRAAELDEAMHRVDADRRKEFEEGR